MTIYLKSRCFWQAIFFILSLTGLLIFSDTILAHERWILTPEQIEQWNSRQRPALFSNFSPLNLTMISIFSAFIVGWVWLGFTGARELFPDLQARLSSYGDHVPRILRVCLGWILLSSAFGVEPRFGVAPFTTPTLFAPDLDLNQLGPEWAWLRWSEVILGLAILFGIYVRLFAALLIVLSFLGAYLFGEAMLAYAGALIGACIYLVLQGPGRHYLPLPSLSIFNGMQVWLADQPRQRAQAIMRILTGTTLLYLGVFFKVLQPNLSIGIISNYQLPILSANPEAFTLVMALVEVSAGILMIAGVLLRPLSLFLIVAFSVFALLLPETPTEHIFFYGVVLSCLINSAGHLRRPVPRDKAAHIVIAGGGLAALQAAIKIEKLTGQYSNVRITLLHEQANFLFAPFLPEVIGGTVQPGNVVNPFRRIIQQTNVVVGHLDFIDEKTQRVTAKRKNNEITELHYDSLIIAPTPTSHFSVISGMTAHACPVDSVADALRIRQRILDLVEEAGFVGDPVEKVRLLTFAIIGSGECASAIAVEVSQILRAAEPSYPVLRDSGWQVHLFQEQGRICSDFEKKISSKRALCLKKAGVIEHLEDEITDITQRNLIFANGKSQSVGLVINAALTFPAIPFTSGNLNWPLAINDELRLESCENIWITETTQSFTSSQFVFSKDQADLGYSAGFNAWANSQGYASRPFKQRGHLIQPYNMGLFSLCRIGWFIFSGKSAWFISRLINLLSVPGLERNLRIIIDWFLVLAFRSDIAILAQTASAHLQRSHFKAGDEVFHQGDAAQMAYVVESGRLKVIQDHRKIRELGPGDYFGEIMPTHLNRRMESVLCLSDCELKIVSQEDLKALIKSGWLMGKAIRNLTDYQSMAADTGLSLGMKRLTYVSKLNAILGEEEILEIGRKSSLNNRKIDVTGVLISVRDYFFQVLEGEEAIVDALVEKIARDPRHHELTILSAETGCEERLFTDWGMKTVALNESNDLMLLAIGMMLQNIAQSYNIVGRYTQPALLKYLMEGINPLTIPAKSAENIVVSGSMTGFSTLSRQFAAEELIDVINSYLEICSASFIEYGGQVAKYSGGCIIAHFSPNDVDASIAACVDAFRKLKASPTIFRTISCGFGLASGAIIEGNIGSSVKMDYTVLGNAVDQAVNLGVLARDLNKTIAVSEPIRIVAAQSWRFEHAGKFALNEPDTVTQVYALADLCDS
ncbi:MAG: BLUF domain-containing protein [Methylococcales bacterium]|nr:BLUF domain-containing protein [Methylococcales bacterium]